MILIMDRLKDIRCLLLSMFCMVIFSPDVSAQLAMGQWRTHFAYTSVSRIAQSENKVFGLSEGSLFSVDKRDENVEYYSKISGLSGTQVSCMEYDYETETLVIVYSNGNIDLLRSGGVENIPDLYNKSMTASKEVNSIYFYGGKAYLACKFGIVVLNLSKKEIAETYYIGDFAAEVDVQTITVVGNSIYANTTTDVYQADITSAHLINYENWHKISLPGSGAVIQVHAFNNELLLLRGSYLYRMANGIWQQVSDAVFTKVHSNDNILLAYSDVVYRFDVTYAYSYLPGTSGVQDAEYDSDADLYWFAAGEQGIVCYNAQTQSQNKYIPNGPQVNVPYRLQFSGKKLFMVQGGRWASQYNLPGYVMMYENGEWTNIWDGVWSAQRGKYIHTKTELPIVDFMDIAVAPNDNSHFYITSYGAGLYEYRNNQFHAQYTHDNSSLETIFPGGTWSQQYGYIRLDGITYDAEGNLWIANSSSNTALKVLSTNGKWLSLGVKDLMNKPTLGSILISSQNKNHKWINSVRSSPGILVFDDNGTLEETSDDKAVFIAEFFDQDNNSIIPASIYCMAQDNDGAIWVGTDVGPLVFSNPNNIFDGTNSCTRIKIPRNDGTNLADFLLEKEEIKAIAIDGANRKWIGTGASGVYLMSADGQETIQHFTTANSPLTSNDILSIAINPVTGEVFIGTGSGLLSYQSDAAKGGDGFDYIYAYPNPVRETYTGVITITGLVDNTTVKITDVAGNLVYETKSNGSLAIWDGKNKSGKKVSTGVYLAICLTEDGSERGITKILVIN